MNLLKRGILGGIRTYRLFSSRRAPVCRFDPTCSQYAIDAIETYGALRGASLATRRVVRCHPWGGYGYDPVPNPAQEDEVRCST
ncbi:MAG: membrane protein insertion efficiency factor YidD [Actinomycetota bacterium]|nr:membrane protein insertion efficiency factor YidD [Acidimicrobiales bacterium]MED5552129.1 membrane protein insertion efficiency factor YidD [Actinomycetota bacterium]